jgi:hypothetical protein
MEQSVVQVSGPRSDGEQNRSDVEDAHLVTPIVCDGAKANEQDSM